MASRYVVAPSELNQQVNSSHRPTDYVYMHMGIQVIKRNQAWRQVIRKKHVLCNDCYKNCVYVHMAQTSPLLEFRVKAHWQFFFTQIMWLYHEFSQTFIGSIWIKRCMNIQGYSINSLLKDTLYSFPIVSKSHERNWSHWSVSVSFNTFWLYNPVCGTQF